MTSCQERTTALHALLDGELDALASVELEEHLRGCPGCRQELQRLQQLRDLIRRADLFDPAPPHLQARIGAIAGERLSVKAVPRRSLWPVALGSGALGVLAASLALLLVMPQVAAPSLSDQLIDGHIRSLQSDHLIDVATSDRHVVKPWFNGRIDFAPAVIDLAPQGFPLVGGRLDVIDRHTVAVIVYRRRLHSINVFVRPGPRLHTPEVLAVRKDTYSLVGWTSGGLEYWAVSDIDLTELQQFRADFLHEAGP